MSKPPVSVMITTGSHMAMVAIQASSRHTMCTIHSLMNTCPEKKALMPNVKKKLSLVMAKDADTGNILTASHDHQASFWALSSYP